MSAAPFRELDRREGDGLVVTLMWEPPTNQVYVSVLDERLGYYDQAPVAAGQALDAFQHPYAYIEASASAGGALALP